MAQTQITLLRCHKIFLVRFPPEVTSIPPICFDRFLVANIDLHHVEVMKLCAKKFPQRVLFDSV